MSWPDDRIVDFANETPAHVDKVLRDRIARLKCPEDEREQETYFIEGVAEVLALKSHKYLITPALIREAAKSMIELKCFDQFSRLSDLVKTKPKLKAAIPETTVDQAIKDVKKILHRLYNLKYGPGMTAG